MIDAETTIRYRKDFRKLVERFVALLQDTAHNGNLDGGHGEGEKLV